MNINRLLIVFFLLYQVNSVRIVVRITRFVFTSLANAGITPSTFSISPSLLSGNILTGRAYWNSLYNVQIGSCGFALNSIGSFTVGLSEQLMLAVASAAGIDASVNGNKNPLCTRNFCVFVNGLTANVSALLTDSSIGIGYFDINLSRPAYDGLGLVGNQTVTWKLVNCASFPPGIYAK